MDSPAGTVRSLFHINLNCSDLESSIRFYEALGFTRATTIPPFETDEADPSHTVIGLHGRVRRAGGQAMMLGDDARQTRLDLMQWFEPAPPPHEPPLPQQVGIPRIALHVRDLPALHERLVAAGVPFVSAPVGPFPEMAIEWIVCALDPDGLIVELIEFRPDARARAKR